MRGRCKIQLPSCRHDEAYGTVITVYTGALLAAEGWNRNCATAIVGKHLMTNLEISLQIRPRQRCSARPRNGRYDAGWLCFVMVVYRAMIVQVHSGDQL